MSSTSLLNKAGNTVRRKMTNSKRYFNQKFIGMMTIICGSLWLVHEGLMSQNAFLVASLISYGVFAGLDSFTVNRDGFAMSDYPEDKEKQ